MKKIHKKIIAIQARAMARAIKQVKFSKTREHYHRGERGGIDTGLRRALCINHQMFHYSLNKAISSKSAIQAKLMRGLFKEFMWTDSKNNAAYFRQKHGRTRPIRHESCWFDFKAYITGQMIGRPDLVRSNCSSMAPSIIDWIHSGAKGIFVYKDRYDRLTASSRQSPWKQLNNLICNNGQGGIKPDEMIVFGAPTDQSVATKE